MLIERVVHKWGRVGYNKIIKRTQREAERDPYKQKNKKLFKQTYIGPI